MCRGKEHEGVYLIIRDEFEVETAWLPALLGEVELEEVGREGVEACVQRSSRARGIARL